MNLSRFYNRLKRYLKLDFKDKIIIIRIFILSAIARFAMLIVPFKILKRFLGNAKEESKYRPNDEEIEYIKKISTYIRRICKHTPWQSKCLVQAIIAQRLLVSKKIESEISSMTDEEITSCDFDEWSNYLYDKYEISPISLFEESTTNSISKATIKRYNQLFNRLPYEKEYYYVDGVRITYKIPYDGVAAVGFHTLPNNNSSTPISFSAGTPLINI